MNRKGTHKRPKILPAVTHTPIFSHKIIKVHHFVQERPHRHKVTYHFIIATVFRADV